MKKNIQKTFIFYPNGKPRRHYFNDDTIIFCPFCHTNFDRIIYGSKICKRCGAKMKPSQTYYLKQSGEPEIE